MLKVGDYIVVSGLSERMDGIEGIIQKELYQSSTNRRYAIITTDNKEIQVSSLYLRKTKKHINYSELMNIALDNNDFTWCKEIFEKSMSGVGQ